MTNKSPKSFDITPVISLLKHNMGVTGPVSYSTLERVSGRLEQEGVRVAGVAVERLPSSSTHELLASTRRVKALRWECVASLWAVLREIGLERRRDLSRMETLMELRRRFDAVGQDAVEPAGWQRHGAEHRTPGVLGAAPGGVALNTDEHEALTALRDLGTLRRGDRAGQHAAMRRLLEVVRERRHSDWWREYGDIVPDWFGPYLSLEPMLERLRIYAPRRVPGLLQSPLYARHVIAGDHPSIGADELARRVELRMLRQRVLRRPEPPICWALINRQALQDPDLPAPVLRDQVKHLITMTSYRNIVVQLVEPGKADRILATEPTILMRFAGASYTDMVYLERDDHAGYLYEADDIERFSLRLELLTLSALDPGNSVKALLGLLDWLS
ncbi:DUF5753 domain-containing protein [Spirillospora sp. CA-294931]|uniref:DUF5753 domain-containing protein n=1 Tax=Spirillospora sp. CA-294931 TaxID=3240042 RepID=UPI003D8A590F